MTTPSSPEPNLYRDPVTIAQLLHTHERVSTLSDIAYHARMMQRGVEATFQQLHTATHTHISALHTPDDALFERALRRLYHDPNEASALFLRAAALEGAERAARHFIESPERYGVLNNLLRPDRVWAPGHSSVDTVEHTRQTLFGAGRHLATIAEAAYHQSTKRYTNGLQRAFHSRLEKLFEHPREAWIAFVDSAAAASGEIAAAGMRTAPQNYGVLRTELTVAARAKDGLDIPVHALAAIDPTVRRLAHQTADAGRAWAYMEVEREMMPPQTRELELLAERAQRTQWRLERTLTDIYAHPTDARRVFGALVAEHGFSDAVDHIRRSPSTLGVLRVELVAAPVSSQKESSHSGPPVSVQLISAEKVAATIERIIDRGRAATDAQNQFDTIHTADMGRASIIAFREQMMRLYTQPSDAEVGLMAHATRHTPTHAIQTLRSTPDAFGTLKTTDRWTPHATAAAAGEMFHGREQLESTRVTMIQQWDMAQGQYHAARYELKAQPARSTLEQQIGQAVSRWLPSEWKQLESLVSAPHVAAARQFAARVKEMALGRDRER